MPTLTAPLKESENYNKIVEALQNGSFSVLAEGCAEAQKLHMQPLQGEFSLCTGEVPPDRDLQRPEGEGDQGGFSVL